MAARVSGCIPRWVAKPSGARSMGGMAKPAAAGKLRAAMTYFMPALVLGHATQNQMRPGSRTLARKLIHEPAASLKR